MKPDRLLEVAAEAAQKAYSPYSEYKVGAALLCADGTVFTGCNVENSSHGMTICAERTAVFSAITAGHRDFVALAVAAIGEQMPYPCGACRQVLNEFCPGEFSVTIAKADALDDYEVISLAELLPHGFHL